MDWAERALAAGVTNPGAHAVASFFHLIGGNYAEAIRVGGEGVALADSPTSPDAFWGYGPLCGALLSTGQYERGREIARLTYASIPSHGPALEAHWASTLAMLEADPDTSPQLLVRAEALAERSQNLHAQVYVVGNSAAYHWRIGQRQEAVAFARRALALCMDQDLRFLEDQARTRLAVYAAIGGVDDPIKELRGAVEAAYENRDWYHVWPCITALATWWNSIGRRDAAGVVLGHLQAHDISSGFPPGGLERAVADASTADDAERRLAEGAALTREQLVEYVLDQLEHQGHSRTAECAFAAGEGGSLPAVDSETSGGAISFDEATALRRVGEGQLRAEVAPGWDVRGNPHGGYLLAIVGRAACHMVAQDDPLSIAASYLAPPEFGEADVSVDVVRAGRRQSTVAVRLVQQDVERVRALVTVGTLADGSPRQWMPDVSAPSIPPPEQCCDIDAVIRAEGEDIALPRKSGWSCACIPTPAGCATSHREHRRSMPGYGWPTAPNPTHWCCSCSPTGSRHRSSRRPDVP